MKTKYFIEINGKPKGPFSIEELNNLNITADTFVWKDGFPTWIKANEIEELNSVIKIPIKKNKISPPPLPIQTFDLPQTPRINKVEIIKTILKLNRKWVLLIILLTFASYLLIAFAEGGFQAIQLYIKYTELIKTPKEQARINSLAQERQFAKELEDRRNYPVDTSKQSPLSHFADSISRGLPQAPKVSESFAKSQKTPILSTIFSFDLSEYRLYLDNPDHTNPNLDNEMISALKEKIYNSFGLGTIFASFAIFTISMLVLIMNSKLWKS